MHSTNCDVGQIFLCNDKCATSNSKHNYLILGINENQDKLGLIQTMSITSMRNKEVKMEVPIRLCNDMISYIVPYNLHSFMTSDIDIRNYKGCIRDTENISSKDFMELLMDIYMDSIGLSRVSHNDIVDRYNKYCSQFWKTYSDCKEFRQFEDEGKFYAPRTITVVKEDDKKNKVTGNTDIKKYKSKNKKYNVDRDRDRRRNKKNVKEFMNSLSGMSVDDINKELNEPTTSYNDNDINIIPVSLRKSAFSKFNITTDDLKKFNDSPRMIKRWNDDDIIKFIFAYKEFGYTKMHEYISNRWNSQQAMSAYVIKAKEEAAKRKLNLSCIDPLMRPIYQWEDKELKEYLGIMKNHKWDINFQLNFTGFDNIHECQQLTYKVKKEMSKRGIEI